MLSLMRKEKGAVNQAEDSMMERKGKEGEQKKENKRRRTKEGVVVSKCNDLVTKL